ncbi:zinc-dependent metalloprotease [Ideonella sp. 4Y16]|uniref:zinc-dependent metalloprotease n=1 Tax=Ideonella alba TaxID=2824118 RepID=UPI001B39783D|nr:zinc-dependent metalloprotease [Ideonella alba]MBQ0943940.1 zinc-dependent metalloprotease [Ideonella alba]
MSLTHRSLVPTAVSLSALLLLGGCASLPSLGGGPATTDAAKPTAGKPEPARSGTASAAPAAPGAAGAAPAAGGPPAFATVTKDAKRIDGLLPLWQKDEKVWLELRPEDLGKPFFLSPKLAQGLGENGLFGGLMVGRWQPWGRAQVVEFRRIANQVQMVARNDQYTAAAGSPEAAAVKSAFSDSLLGSTAVASQAHPDSKAILIDANALFVTDLLGMGMTLQRQYRQTYSFDKANSAVVDLRGNPDETVLRVQAHYVAPTLAQPQPGAPPTTPQPTLPTTLPDARSLFLTLHYSLVRLPAEPMPARRADPRVGYFTTSVDDFGNDLRQQPRQRFINRWRLEKKDPAAALSEPVKPITFWLDRNIPLKYRDAITRGVLGWNAAFERIGFKDALVVKQQGPEDSFDTLDVGAASIRWMTNAKPQFGAIGPSQVDPRTGEILDADIGFESLSSRAIRHTRAQVLAPRSVTQWEAILQAPHLHAPGAEACQHADEAAEQLSYALDVLEARGELDPDSPEAEAYVQAYLEDTTLHEVGHTLGLRHNFRSSRIYTDAQLDDPEFTRRNGLAGSVMEYAPINLPAPGQRGGMPFQTVLGPYDYWAIEYGYKPIEPTQEASELMRIAGRSAEPELAYGTDEDNSLGIDPDSLQMDLGTDPVLFARKRLAIARDLIHRQENRPLKPTEDYTVLRRSISYALRDAGRSVGTLLRQIGGLRTLRDFPGSGRDPLQPVPPAVQREALQLVASQVLAADGLSISPALARKLSTDYLARFDSGEPVATDFSVEGMVLDLQRAVLAQLMSDSVAARVLDNEAKVDRPGQALALSELIDTIGKAVWADALAGGEIPAARRELQREHASRLAERLLRPTPGSRADARALWRAQAQRLVRQLDKAQAAGQGSAMKAAHLADLSRTLKLALEAPLQRSGI